MRVHYFIITLLVLFFLTLTGEVFAEGPKMAASDSAAASAQKGNKAQPAAYTKEAESVYEWCTSDIHVSRTIDCQCLVDEFTELRSKRGPEPSKDLLLSEITRTTCRNIEGTKRMEYARCMRGSGFKYYGIPQEDYCECYAEQWGKLFGGFEGKLDEYKKSSMRFKARVHCKKPGSYKD